MGATVLTVNAQPSRARGARARTGSIVTTLTLRDARDVERLVPGVELVAGEYRATIPMKVGALARQATVSGIEPAYAMLRDAPMRAGRFFTSDDDDAGARVAVLGARIARDMFGTREPVGDQVRLRGIPFTIIGVLPDRGTGLDAFDEDEVVFIPLKTARRRMFQVEYLQRFFVRARSDANLAEVTAAIATLLQTRHRALGTEPADYRVQDQRRLVILRETAIRRLGLFQIVAGVSLLTAGAGGIFALQLLSVRERRAEIGTRRALGATRAAIFWQFVTEAAVIAFIGGALGMAAGMLGATIQGQAPSVSLASTALFACVAACLVAAAEPARRAARLQPAVALRLS
jgi:putative ABC transport system permease protein